MEVEGSPSPFHVGEQVAQEKVGSRDESETLGRKFIRSYMPEQHLELFGKLPTFYVATRDGEGKMWSSLLVGKPGFVSSPDNTRLRISPFRPMGGDGGRFEVGAYIGCLGIELHTRRRNRMNGTIEEKTDDSILIKADQSYGNCPKYIQGRNLEVDESRLASYGTGGGVMRKGELGKEEIDMIKKADTFYIATGFLNSPDDRGVSPSASGCDMSHRGGHQGFVEVLEGKKLVFADFVGNFLFNTIGNIMKDPRAGVLFVDFSTGDVLQITGNAVVDFDKKELPGAERTIEFTVESFIHAKGIVPINVIGEVDPSPYNPQSTLESSGQYVKCVSVKDEAEGVKSFEFSMPVDGAGQPLKYKPGQFATFDIKGLEGDGKVTNRTWTVSSHPSESAKTFAISVKKIGLASGWLHNSMNVGKEILFRGFGGDFSPCKTEKCEVNTPAVLLVAGGIGITPLRSMLSEFRTAGTSVVIVYSTKHSKEAAFLDELESIAGDSNGKIKLLVTVTGEEEGWNGLTGRVDEKFLEAHVPDACEREVYMCGPVGFMHSVSANLQRIGCGMEKVYQESFAF